MSNVTHTTQKNDKKEVTGYLMKIDGATVGTATKTDKGKFNFAPVDGAGNALSDIKTMRDLKVEIAKSVPASFVSANKPKAEPKAAKPAKAQTSVPNPNTGEAESSTEGDIDLN